MELSHGEKGQWETPTDASTSQSVLPDLGMSLLCGCYFMLEASLLGILGLAQDSLLGTPASCLSGIFSPYFSWIF